MKEVDGQDIRSQMVLSSSLPRHLAIIQSSYIL